MIGIAEHEKHRPSIDTIEASRPKGAPAHAWPRWADYDKHPRMIGQAPAWWGWFLLDPYGRGIVWRVALESYRTVPLTGHELLTMQAGPLERVFDGAREAAEAAFRLLAMPLHSTSREER